MIPAAELETSVGAIRAAQREAEEATTLITMKDSRAIPRALLAIACAIISLTQATRGR